jgi:hypothetical protein
MIWAKREFKFAEYGPYQDRFAGLHLSLREPAGMMMVMAKKSATLSDVIISLPDQALLAMFDGFQLIEESDLPKEASILYVDHATDDFEKRFTLPRR